MGIVKVIQNTNSRGDYLSNALNYIKRSAVAYSGYGVDPDHAYEQMMKVKNYFGKTSGNQLMHIVVVFNEYEDDIDICMAYANYIARYFGNRFQVCYALHDKVTYNDNGFITSYYHAHFIFNSVSYIDGRMFADGKGSIGRFKDCVSEITGDRYMKLLYGSDDDGE